MKKNFSIGQQSGESSYEEAVAEFCCTGSVFFNKVVKINEQSNKAITNWVGCLVNTEQAARNIFLLWLPTQLIRQHIQWRTASLNNHLKKQESIYRLSNVFAIW